MHDIEQALRDAWRRVRPLLLRDRDELRRRLARRRLALMQRPPRAWCLALRASDRRIDDTTAVITDAPAPPSSVHPSSFTLHPSAHHVTFTYTDLRHLTWPVLLNTPGEPADEVAKKLGVTPAGLLTARLKNRFHTHHVKGLAGRRGKPVPILYTRDELDPQSREFAAADPLWGWTGKYLADRLDESSFAPQTLTRIPVYRPISDIDRRLRAADAAPGSWEQAEPAPPRPSRKLPPPAPDPLAWYKWTLDGQYLGDDSRFWRKSPNDPGDPAAAARAAQENADKKHAQKLRAKVRRMERAMLAQAYDLVLHTARPRTPGGSLQFRGYAWLCPACGKQCRTLYYPVPPPPLDRYLRPPEGSKGSRKLARLIADDETVDANHADLIPPPLNCFACYKCHRIRFDTRADRNFWNHVIAYLTGGLLYGREVEKPSWLTPARKRPYHPQSHRTAPRRQQVLRRLLNGWTIRKIARDMQISIRAVLNHERALCDHEGVPDRHALASKLGSPHPQPLTQDERARARRENVLALLLQGRSYKQIMAELELDFGTVNRDTDKLYKHHGVKGRHALARKLGVDLKTDEDRRIEGTRKEIRRRRAAGQKWTELAKEMGLGWWTLDHHARALRRETPPARTRQLGAPSATIT